MKLDYQLSRLANQDLENIWKYSFENWSKKQADRYVKQIISQIKKVCSNPEVGKQISRIKPHHRIIKINSHLIVYKVEDEILKVDRIVHLRMDIQNRI